MQVFNLNEKKLDIISKIKNNMSNKNKLLTNLMPYEEYY